MHSQVVLVKLWSWLIIISCLILEEVLLAPGEMIACRAHCPLEHEVSCRGEMTQ
jgi:hypothetical protein